jgi:hypothetical protein
VSARASLGENMTYAILVSGCAIVGSMATLHAQIVGKLAALLERTIRVALKCCQLAFD